MSGTHGSGLALERARGGPSAALHALVSQVVDYAGLFPPAGLALALAARNYAAYRKGRCAWMLGRFVVPATQLAALSESGPAVLPVGDHAIPWRISALVGPDIDTDLTEIRAFNDRHGHGSASGRASVDGIETKVHAPAEVGRAASLAPRHVRVAFEVPVEAEPEAFLAAIGEAGGVAKLRLGGVVPRAIPDVRAVARWLASAAAHAVPIKATAGLHHAVRAERFLTYDEAAPRAVTHGFLNVFVAGCLAYVACQGLTQLRGEARSIVPAAARADHGGGDVIPLLEAVLSETEPAAFAVDDETVRWRERSLTLAQVSGARQHFALSFGSCSFEEPVEDLRALGLLRGSA